MATENANKYGSETAHGATSELRSTGWLSAEAFARDVISSARKHGFTDIKLECRSEQRMEFWDGLTISWDGGRHGENQRFHLKSTAHHYGEADNATLGYWNTTVQKITDGLGLAARKAVMDRGGDVDFLSEPGGIYSVTQVVQDKTEAAVERLVRVPLWSGAKSDFSYGCTWIVLAASLTGLVAAIATHESFGWQLTSVIGWSYVLAWEWKARHSNDQAHVSQEAQ